MKRIFLGVSGGMGGCEMDDGWDDGWWMMDDGWWMVDGG